jgi:hypothetical protein
MHGMSFHGGYAYHSWQNALKNRSGDIEHIANQPHNDKLYG